jgi:GxxExxY protein
MSHGDAGGTGAAKRSERDFDGVATDLLGAAVEVHRILGPGLLEGIYEEALACELDSRGIPYARQPAIELAYKGRVIGDLRPDLVVQGSVIVELKAVDRLAPVHLAQALSYLRATDLPLALLINFNAPLLLRGVRRVILTPIPIS